jgi:hypothetical protein
MNKIKTLLLYTFLFSVMSCNTNNESQPVNSSVITIGNYRFTFPKGFELTEGQGIDSYIGTVNGSGISLFFDYGMYTSPAVNLDPNEYLVIEDEINGHFRQIVKPVNPELNYTSIHLYKISDVAGSVFGYKSLTLSTNNLTLTQQEMIINVFTSVEIIQ